LDWLSQSILFNHSNYYSHSNTVAHWDSPRGPLYGSTQRAAMPRQPDGYNRSQFNQPRDNFGRSGNGYNGTGGQGFARPQNSYAPNRSFENSGRGYQAPSGNYARPAPQNYAYNRSQLQGNMSVRPQQSYARPGYASGFYGGAGQGYANRPGSVYASPQQNWRSAAPAQQRGGFAQRSYAAPAGRGFMQSPGRQERSGGFHLFGGGHGAAKSYGGGHASGGFGGGRHSGGGGHSGGHSGGGHHR